MSLDKEKKNIRKIIHRSYSGFKDHMVLGNIGDCVLETGSYIFAVAIFRGN